MHYLAGVFALLSMAFLVPQQAYSHESGVPTILEEEATSPEDLMPSRWVSRRAIAQDQPAMTLQDARTLQEARAVLDDGHMVMNHPGLPMRWILVIVAFSAIIFLRAVMLGVPPTTETKTKDLSTLPVIGPFFIFLNSTPIPLFVLKVITATAYIMVVISGFFGSVYPERNLATVLVWNWWWPLVIVSVIILGSAWCAICPWDNLASWLIRRKLWRRSVPHPGFNKKVPKYLRNVWVALALFMGLTFLELGIGVTTIPKMTAVMALVMFTLSFVYLIFYERKAFCRYGCPVGRTLGFYSRIAPLSLRPRQQLTCDNCKTVDCYRGSEKYEPCPTSLTIGKFSQNTYCISCGNCALNCPYDNVSWRLRPMGSEAKEGAHPTWDGTWFMVILLGITTFHGVTMWPYWNPLVILLANAIGETGKLYWSFTILMFIGFALPVLVYAVAVFITRLVARSTIKYKQIFVALSFSALPLAFTYHLAHNMNHLFREGSGILALFLNPLGIGLDPMTDGERHMEMMDTPPVDLIFGLQAGLIIIGIFLSVHILRHRGARILPNQPGITGWQLSPMLVFFVTLIASVNVWLLSQEMVMRF